MYRGHGIGADVLFTEWAPTTTSTWNTPPTHDQVLGFQQVINPVLYIFGYEPIPLDGALTYRFCGAMNLATLLALDSQRHSYAGVPAANVEQVRDYIRAQSAYGQYFYNWCKKSVNTDESRWTIPPKVTAQAAPAAAQGPASTEDTLRYANAMTCEALRGSMHCINAGQTLLIAAAIAGKKPPDVTTATFNAWVNKVKACKLHNIAACSDVPPFLRNLQPVPSCLNAEQYQGQQYCASHRGYIWSGNRVLNSICWLASRDASYLRDWLAASPCAGVVRAPAPPPPPPPPPPSGGDEHEQLPAPPTSEMDSGYVLPSGGGGGQMSYEPPSGADMTSAIFMPSPEETPAYTPEVMGAEDRKKKMLVGVGIAVGVFAIGGALFMMSKKRSAA